MIIFDDGNKASGEGKRDGMTHHVGRGKVAHDELVLTLPENLSNFFSYTVHAHLGELVVGGYLRRCDHMSFFILELFLNTSVKEKGDVSVFLSLWSIDK